MTLHVLSRKAGYATNSSSYHNMIMMGDEDYEKFKAEEYLVEYWSGALVPVEKSENGYMYIDGSLLVEKTDDWSYVSHYEKEWGNGGEQYYTIDQYMAKAGDGGHEKHKTDKGEVVHAVFTYGRD